MNNLRPNTLNHFSSKVYVRKPNVYKAIVFRECYIYNKSSFLLSIEQQLSKISVANEHVLRSVNWVFTKE